jgi:DNA-binding LytR/AlgR family response regulator
MQVFNAYIIDDEPKAIALLENYIERIPFLNLLGTNRNPLKGFSFLQKQTVDVLFLDINMPNLSGLELYRSLDQPPMVIFTTAYPEFAVEGFNVEAIDYLVKPIYFSRFVKACNRIPKLHQLEKRPFANETSFLTDIIYIKSGTTTYKINWRDIYFLEKDENYIVYHQKEKRILSRQILSDLEELFPAYICRVHKSYAISLLHLQKLERGFAYVKNQKIPIGRSYKAQLMKALEKRKK